MNISGVQSTRKIMDAYYLECVSLLDHLDLLDPDEEYWCYTRQWNRAVAYTIWYEQQQEKSIEKNYVVIAQCLVLDPTECPDTVVFDSTTEEWQPHHAFRDTPTQQYITVDKEEHYLQALTCLEQMDYLTFEEACRCFKGYEYDHANAITYTRWYEQQQEKAA